MHEVNAHGVIWPGGHGIIGQFVVGGGGGNVGATKIISIIY